MSNLTTLVNHHLWGDTSAPDIYRTIQIYGDETLLSLDEKGLARALRFGSVQSLRNYLARAVKRGHLAGEIGNLDCPCAWLLRLVAPSPPVPQSEPAPAHQALGETRQPRRQYPSDFRRHRSNGHSAGTPQSLRNHSAEDSAPTPQPPVAESHTGGRENGSVCSVSVVFNKTDGSVLENRTENTEQRTEPNGEGESVRAGEGNGLRLTPPMTPQTLLRRELMAAGFSAFDADGRLKKHPPERLREIGEDVEELTW